MLKWLIRNRLAAFEKTYGYDATYVRELLDIDSRAFFAFARATSIGNYKKDAPRDVLWATRLVGIVAEDCGPCSQLTVTMALREGVPARVLAAVLSKEDAALPDDVRLGVQFARAVVAHAPEADELREQIVARWGMRAVVAIAFGLTAAKIYPTVKYALGYGKACQRLVVEGETVAVVRSAPSERVFERADSVQAGPARESDDRRGRPIEIVAPPRVAPR